MYSRISQRKLFFEKTFELAMYSPQVVAYRMAKFSKAGGRPSLSDQDEYWRMIFEKNNAFIESWNAMMIEAIKSHHAFVLSFMNPFYFFSKQIRFPFDFSRQIQKVTYNILEKGIVPIHKKARENAKRLGRYSR